MNQTSHDSETPAQGQQAITACAFIHCDFDGVKKLFLPKRAATKKFLPNIYELPGGHIDFGEDIIDGLKREITEEFGMTISVGDPFAAFTYKNMIKGSHSIEVVYFATFNEPLDKIQIDPQDHSEYGWYSIDELSIITAHRPDNDPEVKAAYKGFAFLSGESPNFS